MRAFCCVAQSKVEINSVSLLTICQDTDNMASMPHDRPTPGRGKETMMATRYQPARKCPECEGCGVIEIRLDVEALCSCCVGNGSIDSTHERYAEATRWPVDRRDPLLEMGANRAHYLIQRRMPWGADTHPYRKYRKDAMKLVDLPPLDAHLLVSSETAAYFNKLTRNDPIAAEVFAPMFRAMGVAA